MCMSVAHYVHAQQSSPRVTSALQEHRSIHDAREGRGGEGRGVEGQPSSPPAAVAIKG